MAKGPKPSSYLRTSTRAAAIVPEKLVEWKRPAPPKGLKAPGKALWRRHR